MNKDTLTTEQVVAITATDDVLLAAGPGCIRVYLGSIECVSGVYTVCIWGVYSEYLGCFWVCILDVF